MATHAIADDEQSLLRFTRSVSSFSARTRPRSVRPKQSNVSGGEQCVWRKGYLGLESEGAPVDWRNIRIKEMPSTGATAEQSAPVAEAK